MFEKEIQFISDFTLNKVKKLGSFFTFEKLFSANIHPAIVQYISAELDYLIYEDRKRLLNNSVFDYSGGEISKHFLTIGREIKKSKKVSYEDVKSLVVQAVSFNINFTARPRWSAAKLAFDNEEIRTTEEINLLLNYIYYYDYIRNVVKAYIQKKGIVNISASDFNMVLGKLDKELFAARADELIDNALYAIADFSAIGSVNKKIVSVSSIEMFLKEKNLIDYLFKLRKAMPSDAKQKYSIEEIRRVIDSAAHSDKSVVLPSEEEPIVFESPDEESNELLLEEEDNNELFISDELEEVETHLNDENDYRAGIVEEINPEFEDKNIEGTFLDEEVLDTDPLFEENSEIQEDQSVEEEFSSEAELPIHEVDEDLSMLSEEDDNLLNELQKDDEEIKNDDFLSVYKKELDDLSAHDIDLTSDEEEIEFDLTDKEHLDVLYDFEEEADAPSNDEIKDEEKHSSEEGNTLPKIEDDIHDDESITGIAAEEVDDGGINSSASKTQKAKDIFVYISDKEIDKIVSNIFNEDRDDFATTMEKIAECSSYEEATEILKGVFFTYRVNPYSRDAITLTNAVSKYFEQA